MPFEMLHAPDAHWRSFTKGVSWRIIGTLDTFVWSLLITGKPFSAASIATLETITKIVLFYGHERLWHLVPWSPDGHGRAFAKAVSWRFVGSLDTFFLSLIVTGKLHYAVSIASVEALTKIVLYYLHERAWRLIRWGRHRASGLPVGAGAGAAG